MENQEKLGAVLSQALGAAMLGVANGKITSKAADAVCNIGSDWSKIINYQIRCAKLLMTKEPSIRPAWHAWRRK